MTFDHEMTISTADLQFGLRWVHVLHTRALQTLDDVLNQKEEAS